MAQYWTYGLNDQGEPQLLGPFEDEGEDLAILLAWLRKRGLEAEA